MIKKIRTFISEVVSELKKVSWTSRREVMDATLLVIVSSLALAVVIFVIDFILSKFVGIIIT